MRTVKRLIVVLVRTVCPPCSWAVPRAPAASKPKVIRFGKLVDGTSKVWSGAAIVVQDDRIVSVQNSDSATPSSAEVIDLTRYFGIPGLIDVHTHMTYYWDGADGTRPWQQLAERMPAVTVFLARENFGSRSTGAVGGRIPRPPPRGSLALRVRRALPPMGRADPRVVFTHGTDAGKTVHIRHCPAVTQSGLNRQNRTRLTWKGE
jgi:hypothetical protein